MTSILVVEDEHIVARQISRTLRALGYTVPATAGGAEEAVEKAAQFRPDLVLMDINLGGMRDGIHAAGILRRTLNIPVVYLTAYCDNETIARARMTEPLGYLMKPISEADLRRAVDMAVHNHTAAQARLAGARVHAATLQSLGDAVLTTDVAGRIVLINAAATALTGWSQEEAQARLASDVVDVVHEETAQRAEPTITKALELRADVPLPLDALLVRRNGPPISIEGTTVPILDDQGVLLGAAMVFRDSDGSRKLDARMLQSERRATLSRVTARMAAEVERHQTAATHHLDLARAALDLHESLHAGGRADTPAGRTSLRDLREALRGVHAGASALAVMVADLRALSSSESGPPQLIDVRRVLEMALRMTRGEMCGRAVVVTQLEDVLPAFAHEAQLLQVFLIVLLNAAAAARTRGTEDCTVTVALRSPDHGVVVAEVSHNGGMVPSAVLRQLLDPEHGGRMTGPEGAWGLPLCVGLMTAMGGTLGMESTPGCTTVTVTLQGIGAWRVPGVAASQ